MSRTREIRCSFFNSVVKPSENIFKRSDEVSTVISFRFLDWCNRKIEPDPKCFLFEIDLHENGKKSEVFGAKDHAERKVTVVHSYVERMNVFSSGWRKSEIFVHPVDLQSLFVLRVSLGTCLRRDFQLTFLVIVGRRSRMRIEETWTLFRYHRIRTILLGQNNSGIENSVAVSETIFLGKERTPIFRLI